MDDFMAGAWKALPTERQQKQQINLPDFDNVQIE